MHLERLDPTSIVPPPRHRPQVHYWERMRMNIPYVAMEINAQREKYRVLRDNMLTIVRDYNKILLALDREERRLFHDRIRLMDRRIMPGVSKLTWTATSHQLDFFYREARKVGESWRPVALLAG